MNDTELTQLLTYIHVTDNRQVDELVLGVWKDLIGHLDYQDALAGVKLHRQEAPGTYLEQGHVLANANRIRRARLDSKEPVCSTMGHKFIGRDGDCVLCGLIPNQDVA